MRVVKEIDGAFKEKESEEYVLCAFDRTLRCITNCAACYIQQQEGIKQKVHCLRFSSFSGLLAYID